MRGDGEKDEEEMSDAGGGARRVGVGDLGFDAESGELVGPDGLSRLAPQPASLLALLASRPGELVTRDEIRERLWPGGRVEFEQGIAFAVREVRKAIESVGGDPAVLETIPKRGFRLNGPGSATAAMSVPAAMPPTRPRRANSLSLVLPPLGAVAVIALIGLGVSTMGRPPADLPAVVVFVHDTEDDGHVELAQALGYELTTALTRAFDGRLGIIGPTGSAVLSGPNDTEGARASLGACLVVSGGIRAVGADSVVVFTQVVRTLDRVHAWASQDTVRTSAVATVVPIAIEGVESAASAC
jgi:DNA-binding winged helix-turn-helix (wHTH) protein/TolB-like protein